MATPAVPGASRENWPLWCRHCKGVGIHEIPNQPAGLRCRPCNGQRATGTGLSDPFQGLDVPGTPGMNYFLLRRREIQTDHVDHLGDQLRVGGEPERLGPTTASDASPWTRSILASRRCVFNVDAASH
jgi:hypothetical protein